MPHAFFWSQYVILHGIAFAPFVLILAYTIEIQLHIKQTYSYNTS